MTRDPWADDWEDDWTKAAKTTKSNSEIWSQANSLSSTVPTTDIPVVAPAINYRPQVKILKRESSNDMDNDTKIKIDPRHHMDKATREARYKEARERLFGTPEPMIEVEPPLRRHSPAHTPGAINPSVSKPERQSKGPENSGRGGFAARGRAQSRKVQS
ncbi:protein of unknown function [Taphrina deformans PYCC 5710]|uniref:SUZ domain-containing protein n=1 Tax=Taphrina deformans (strain PYCC 5710 / ATCC 11124 / CBS 356.35 / IMI 108563 / JCM 9778 / NBRC 8474) TaxID=1097556 RepID=R4XCP1_TAPDE|nr:protein of unknown function [Taphrina deformans PYCC 5710]|eukprot:CCG83388.1 protein of unknown function [Taphrina deformans PYCC 5710]